MQPKAAILVCVLAACAAGVAARATGDDAPAADCPKPDQVLAGVTLLCGKATIKGTVPRSDVPLCDADGQVDCIATAAFPAMEVAELPAEDIALGQTLAGVAGTYEYELDADKVTVCNFDGQQTCRITGSLVTLDTTIAEDKILAGFFAGGVPGIAVSDAWRRCETKRDEDCLTYSAFRAISVEFLDACEAAGL